MADTNPLADLVPAAPASTGTAVNPLADIVPVTKSSGTSLPDAYHEASKANPDDVSQALEISRRRQIDPNYALSNIKDVKKADAAPDFDAMKTGSPKTYSFLHQDPTLLGIAHDDLHSFIDLESHAKTAKVASSMLESAKAGWQDSVRGREMASGSPDLVLGPNPSLLNESIAQGVGMAVDLPEFVSFGALGALAGPVTGTAAAFGGHAALKQALIERDHGSIESAAELLRRSKAVAYPAAKGAVTGAALALTGGAATIYGAAPATKLALEIGAMSTTGAAVEGRMATVHDLISNSIAFLGAHAASMSWERMGEVAEQSKTRARGEVGAKAFADHADAVSGPAYIPVEKWDELHGPGVEDINKKLGIEQSYKAAKAQGPDGVVEIPAGKYLSADMDAHREALKDDLKEHPDAPSINQAKEQDAEGKLKDLILKVDEAEGNEDPLAEKMKQHYEQQLEAVKTDLGPEAHARVKANVEEHLADALDEGYADGNELGRQKLRSDQDLTKQAAPGTLSNHEAGSETAGGSKEAGAQLTPEDRYAASRARRAGDETVRHDERGSGAVDQGLRRLKTFTPNPELTKLLSESGFPAVTMHELEPVPENAKAFSDAITASKNASKFGAAVYVYPEAEYHGMRKFTSDDGKSGFAIKPDGDIVSVFSDGGKKAYSMLALAVEQGGKKLDCFDTVLPEIYATAGFKEVKRDPWNEAYAPPGWDKNTFAKFNNGEPDIVYMEYDPKHVPEGISQEAPAAKPTLPYTPYPGLTPRQRSAETNLARILSQPDAAEKYAALPGTEGGKILDVDEARALSPEYNENNTTRLAYTLATHKPSSAFIRQLYKAKLAEPATGPVLFMAGGGGSGKSTVRKAFLSDVSANADIIMDGTLSKYQIAHEQIEAALASGRNVTIAYVHRPFESAVKGVVARAGFEKVGGRWVPSEALAEDHVGAQETYKTLAENYRGDPRVTLKAFENPDSRPESYVKPTEISLEKLHELSYAKEGEHPTSAVERLTKVARGHNGEIESAAQKAGQLGGDEPQAPGDERGDRRVDEAGVQGPEGEGQAAVAFPTPLQEREQATSQVVTSAQQETGQNSEPIPGADPRDQAELDKATERARKEAENILLKPQLEELKRENKSLLDAERKRVTAEIKNQIENEPVFKAVSLLDMSNSEMWQMAHKYRNNALDNEATLHFEAVAEMSGFSSADEMAHKLLLTDPTPTRNMMLKERVNQHMEQFAHLKDTAAMREEAMRAVHTDQSGELISLQSQVLQGMAQNAEINAETAKARRAYASEMWEASKQLARDTINAKPIESAGRFRAYYTAERNAAVRAEKEQAAGNYQEAGAARLEQMHSHALAAEALRVRDSIDSWHRSIEKQQKSDPSAWKSEDHFFQAAAILNRFGFPREDFDPTKRAENLQSWAARMDEKSSGMVSIPAWLQDESVTKDWRKLTPPELQDVRNALNNIKHVANAEDKMFYIGNGIELEALANDLHEAKMANVVGGKTPGAGTYVSDWQKLTHAKDTLLNNIIAPETFMSELDGFKMKGLWQDTLMESKNKAMDARGAMNAEDAAKLREIHSAYSAKELRDMHKPIFIPELDPKGQFTKDNLITLACNQGTEGNQVKVRESRGWSQATVDAVLKKHLDARDWDLVQAKLDWMESRKPLMAELHKRVTGFEPTWVPAKTIQTPFGEKAGGYYPLISDHRVVSRGFENMKVDAMLNDPPVTFKAATQQGFMKERNDNARYAVSLDGSGFVRHMSDVTHDLTMREWVIDASRVLGNKSVAADIQDAFGMENYQGLKTWLKQVAGNDVKPLREAVDGIAASMRRRSTVSQLGGKLSVMLSQIHGLTAAASVDPDNFGRTDVVAGIMNVYGKMLMKPSSFHETMELVDGKSPYMKQSGMDADRDISEAARSISGNDTNMMQFAQKGFKMMHDLTMKPLWLQAYKVGLRVHDGNEANAISYADKIIRGSTTGGRASDMPAIMRGSETGKLMTMFHGFVNAQTQLMYKASGRVHAAGDIPAFVGTYMNVMVLPGAMYALFHYGMPTDKKSQKMWQKAMLRSASPLSMVPVVSTLQDWAIDRALDIPGHTSLSPAGGGLDALYDLLQTATSRKAHTQKILESATKVASYTGLPIPGRVPGLGNMFMQAFPDQYSTWLWNTVDVVHNGMTPRPSDLMKRRPARERSQ